MSGEALFFRRGKAQDEAGGVQDNVDGSIGTAHDVADATGVFEEDFFVHDAALFDVEYAQVF